MAAASSLMRRAHELAVTREARETASVRVGAPSVGVTLEKGWNAGPGEGDVALIVRQAQELEATGGVKATNAGKGGRGLERGHTTRDVTGMVLPEMLKELGYTTKQRLRDFFGNTTRSPLTTLVFVLFSVAVNIFHDRMLVRGSEGVVVPNFFLGLIITLLSFLNGFRNNTAYARWWEGRCLWGKHIYLSVDLAQKFATFVPDRKLARRLGDLIVEFAHFSRLLLRKEDSAERINAELLPFRGHVSEDELRLFTHTEGWKAYTLISAMRQVLYKAARHDSILLFELDKAVTELAKCIGGCIRIRNSPLPKTYVLYLQVCSFSFCLLFPLTIVSSIGWWSVFATTLNVLMLLGIQGISEAMEEPFGRDDDDLKLDEFCNAIEKQVHSQLGWILEHNYDAAYYESHVEDKRVTRKEEEHRQHEAKMSKIMDEVELLLEQARKARAEVDGARREAGELLEIVDQAKALAKAPPLESAATEAPAAATAFHRQPEPHPPPPDLPPAMVGKDAPGSAQGNGAHVAAYEVFQMNEGDDALALSDGDDASLYMEPLVDGLFLRERGASEEERPAGD